MLNKIFIQNFALIEHLDINFQKGLQIITGETGSGKSIVVEALRLILGQRADMKYSADPTKKSVVEAFFSVGDELKAFFEANDLDFETNSIVRRELLPSGKSRAFVNDVPVNLSLLQELSQGLLDIHSQFDNAELFKQEYQLKVLDTRAKNQEILFQYQALYTEYGESKRLLSELEDRQSYIQKESDYHNHLLDELDSFRLEELHYEALKNELSATENHQLISENLHLCLQDFSGEERGVVSMISRLSKKLQKILNVFPASAALFQRMESLYLEAKDIHTELLSLSESIHFNPDQRDILKEKIDSITALFEKHRVNSVEELLKIRDELSSKRGESDELMLRIQQIKHALEQAEKGLYELSEKLRNSRHKVSQEWTTEIQNNLSRMGLEKAEVLIDVSPLEGFSSSGRDKVQILFRANAGYSFHPIQSSISGGECSRLMLAIKKTISETIGLPTLVLDEIDSGISGRIAKAMGEMMKDMGKNTQLIVITHLAQIAAKGDHNYKVVKEDKGAKSRSSLIALNSEEKILEIASLLSGNEITEAAVAQAKELTQ